MKIITGRAKGMTLKTLEGDQTRPTSQRVKEAIFSMLQFEIENSRVLDIFAGSGQMGLEALSRGAKRAVFGDCSKEAVKIITENAKKSKLIDFCDIYCCDYKQLISKASGKYDIIFIDPPYKDKIVLDVLERLICANLLSDTSKIICETGDENIFEGDISLKEKFDIIKTAKYSISYVTILKLKSSEE